MRNSIFGWSYPPGCSGPPEEKEWIQPRCEHCGSYLKNEPDRTEPWEDYIENPDGKQEIIAAGYFEYRMCKRCNKESRTCY